jgi:hypothetical protein
LPRIAIHTSENYEMMETFKALVWTEYVSIYFYKVIILLCHHKPVYLHLILLISMY